MRDQWICLNFLFKTFGIPASTADALRAAFLCGLEALTLLPSDLVLPVLTFNEMVLPQVSLKIKPKFLVFFLIVLFVCF